ncbi:MAG: hypothetical protein ACXWUG_11935 [Polyangiales bacterium]
MSRRLFHAIVLVGAGMGCSSTDTTSGPSTTDAKSDVIASDGSIDTFPGIMPEMMDSSSADTGTKADSTAGDTFPTIMADTGTDTFPGISPATDSFPGIMPPPPPPPSPHS